MKRTKAKDQPGDGVLPFDRSVGYQIRATHRLMQRYLQQKIEPHGMTLGMWYFLRALWHEDGQTQRELSEIVGTMDPTTLTAIRSMERSGLVRRVRNSHDRRKINVYLTRRGKDLRPKLLPRAREVVDHSLAGFSDDEKEALFRYLNAVQRNVQKRIEDEAVAGKE